MRTYFLSLAFVLLSIFPATGQEGLFRPPFDFPLFLSGNFAELRSNHFHGGVDFKTQGVEGKPLLCPADGHISRISVSPGGYGNALYITHDNGYTTVHGHLQRFLPEVAALVREHQYKYQTFPLDTTLTPDRFPVKQGEVVAWAGNSGYSFGPHLHMEVRLTETNEPVNPLVFYKDKLKDTRPPRAHRIKIYPMKGQGIVNESETPHISAFGKGNHIAQPLTAWGKVGIALSANDYMDGTHNTYGVYSVRLLVDGEEIFASCTDRFSFDENLLINSWTDYAEYRTRSRWYMKSFVAPGNPLRMLHTQGEGRGIVTISEERPYHFEYILSDLHGNTSRYTFEIMGKSHPLFETTPSSSILKWDKENTISHPLGLKLTIPHGRLYEDADLRVSVSSDAEAYSSVYSLEGEAIPLSGYSPIAIKVWPDCAQSPSPSSGSDNLLSAWHRPWPTIPPTYASKLYIAHRQNGHTSSLGGRYEAGWMKAQLRELSGHYFVAIDTISPLLTPLMPEKWSKTGIIRLKATDVQTGITHYRATLDGRWTLMEYSSKNRQFTIRLAHSPLKKKGLLHDLTIHVTDGVGNTTTFRRKVRY